MTLDKFMLVYQENQRDLFIIYSEDGKELQRFSMLSYFTEGYATKYGDSKVISVVVDVIDRYCLNFQIYLDDLNPKAK